MFRGPVTARRQGQGCRASVYNAAVLEEVAKMAATTYAINPQATALPPHLIQKHYQRKHGAHAYTVRNRPPERT
jgi:L-ribulose-5-phosphate 4-epimerase